MDLDAYAELGAVRSRFASVAASWRLDCRSAAALLCMDGDWRDRSLLELLMNLHVRAETAMRLACEVDALLPRLVPRRLIADWLRSPGMGFVNELMTPLQILSTGPAALRAMRAYLEQLPIPEVAD